MTGRARLLLAGDDEALDVLAELSRHLDFFEVARVDAVPEEALGAEDHLVIGLLDPVAARAALDQVLERGRPGFASVVPALPQASVGARAILVAAELVAALHPRGAAD